MALNDVNQLLSLSKLFGIDLPKNQVTNLGFLKSRSFVLAVKEAMLKRLFFALNETNGALLDYSQARHSYQQSAGGYKLYVGSGNNAQLITQQIFKENRWWWNVGVQTVFSGATKAGGKEAGKGDGAGGGG